MHDRDAFDFWYAVNNTEALILPSSRLETFGTTMLNYHLVSEFMDSVNRVRIREGRIEAFRPQILTPESLAQTLLEGFGHEAREYADWLRAHQHDLHLLRYGFTIRKQERSEYVVSEPLAQAVDQIERRLRARNDPLTALAIGVEQPWEVCLLKLMVEVVEQSVAGNVSDLRKGGLLPHPQGPRGEIEAGFREASRDASRIPDLHRLLERHGRFKEYEDRFFALVRRSHPTG